MQVYLYNSLLVDHSACYVGSTIDPKNRHRMYNNMHFKKQTYFYRWAKKYGLNNMQLVKFDINAKDEKELRLWEQFYISLFGSYVLDNDYGLNLIKNPTQNNSCDERVKKIRSEAWKGEKNPMYGKKHTKETILKTSKQIAAYKVKISGIQGKHKYNVDIISDPIIFNSIRDCAMQLNVERRVIQRICKGVGKSSKGYTFKYI